VSQPRAKRRVPGCFTPSLASSVRVFWSWVVSARPRESRSPVWRLWTKESGSTCSLEK
jgi:hypothetical protein